MNNIKSLIKINFKNNFKFLDLELSGKDRLKNILILIFALFILIPLYVSFVGILWFAFDVLKNLKVERFFLQSGIVFSGFLIMIFSIPKIINTFYFDEDIERLLPLPIKKFELLGSKFIYVFLRELFKIALVYTPFAVIYGMKKGEGVTYYLTSILNGFLLPIYPMVVVSLLIFLLMKYTNLSRNKNLFRVFGFFIITVATIFLQVFIQKQASSSIDGGLVSTDQIASIVGKYIGSVQKGYNIFYPISILSSNSLYYINTLKGLVYLIGNIFASGFLVFAMLFVGDRIYLDGYLIRGGKKENQVKKKRGNINYTRNRASIAICKKEILDILRNPIYAFNILGGSIIVPIVFLVTFSVNKDTKVIVDSLSKSSSLFFQIIIVAMIVFLGFSQGSATTFSREGKSFALQKQLPIKARDQGLGRALGSLALGSLSIVLIGLVSKFYLKGSLFDMAVIFIYGSLFSIPIINLSIAIDVRKPKLDWTSPEKVVKQNMNVMKTMVVDFVYLVVLGLITALAYKFMAQVVFYIAMFLLALILIYFSFKLMVGEIEKALGN